MQAPTGLGLALTNPRKQTYIDPTLEIDSIERSRVERYNQVRVLCGFVGKKKIISSAEALGRIRAAEYDLRCYNWTARRRIYAVGGNVRTVASLHM